MLFFDKRDNSQFGEFKEVGERGKGKKGEGARMCGRPTGESVGWQSLSQDCHSTDSGIVTPSDLSCSCCYRSPHSSSCCTGDSCSPPLHILSGKTAVERTAWC